jgi:hypothetical protein
LAALSLFVLSAVHAMAQGCVGAWESPFNHNPMGLSGWPQTFEAVHMALITQGQYEGKVLVWDATIEFNSASNSWLQRWAILDPEAQTFVNRTLSIPGNVGTPFCAGHAWTHDGRLLVVGGTDWSQLPATVGNRLAYLYDPASGPPEGTWVQQTDMDRVRWYPTVLLLGEQLKNRLLVLGGWNQNPPNPGPNPPPDTAINNYEAFDLTQSPPWQGYPNTRLFAGPRCQSPPTCSPGDISRLDVYPRMHLLSELAFGGQPGLGLSWAFMSGMFSQSAHVDHSNAPGAWPPPQPSFDPSPNADRFYGSSVLYPNLPGFQDVVMITGGDQGAGPMSTVQYIDGKLSSPSWIPAPSMTLPRVTHNAVLLPDASILAVGGRKAPDTAPPEDIAARKAEIFKNGMWTLSAEETSARTYHSTAVLLPSGKVLSGGADDRSWDYQVYVPPYLCGGQTRPVVASLQTITPGYDSVYTASYNPLPFGVTVQKVVLMAPGSVTHHSDMHQRYVELVVQNNPATNTIAFVTPRNPTYAPRGYYMLFLLTDGGVPSQARFIKLQ